MLDLLIYAELIDSDDPDCLSFSRFKTCWLNLTLKSNFPKVKYAQIEDNRSVIF